MKARDSKLGAERQENLERGSMHGAAWQEGRPTSAIDAFRITRDGQQGLTRIICNGKQRTHGDTRNELNDSPTSFKCS